MKQTILYLFIATQLSAQHHTGALRNVILGDSIPGNHLAYIKQADGKAYLAQPSDTTAATGLVLIGGNTGDTSQIWYDGEHFWPYGGLRAGRRYYLDTSGTFTARLRDDWHQFIGVAIDDSTLVLNIGEVRAAHTPPWLTTSQRDGLPFPKDGDMIYNTTTATFQGRRGGFWVDLH